MQSARPRYFDGVGNGYLSQAEVSAKIAVREVAAAGHDLADLSGAAGAHAHACTCRVTVALSADELEVQGVIVRAAPVVQQQRRMVVVGFPNVKKDQNNDVNDSGKFIGRALAQRA